MLQRDLHRLGTIRLHGANIILHCISSHVHVAKEWFPPNSDSVYIWYAYDIIKVLPGCWFSYRRSLTHTSDHRTTLVTRNLVCQVRSTTFTSRGGHCNSMQMCIQSGHESTVNTFTFCGSMQLCTKSSMACLLVPRTLSIHCTCQKTLYATQLLTTTGATCICHTHIHRSCGVTIQVAS